MENVDFSKFNKLRKGKNKRRGFFFTYKDIAKITGYTTGSLKTLASRGTFNPKKLESLVKFVMLCLLKKEAQQEKVS